MSQQESLASKLRGEAGHRLLVNHSQICAGLATPGRDGDPEGHSQEWTVAVSRCYLDDRLPNMLEYEETVRVQEEPYQILGAS